MLGAFIRYKITSFPAVFGIIGSNVIIVNMIGSFILGVFSNLSVSLNLDPKYSFLIAIGFCGTLTTMSSFALESVTMFDNKQLFQMTINVLSNVFLSLLSVYMGRILISQILGNINGS
ncbi:MAG TPA: CrcB family protein [Verrucomicrobiae bacterium]|nr:CrcB family protein [Verrucomicrobiae bacterium]